MAVAIISSSQAADEEARAEVEVLHSRLEKTAILTRKLQASLARLETGGKSVQGAAGSGGSFGKIQELQALERSMYVSFALG